MTNNALVDSKLPLEKHLPNAGALAYGCMGHGGAWNQVYLQSKCGIRLENELGPKRYDFSAGLVEYCQEKKLQLQAWGSLAQGIYSGARSVTSRAASDTIIAKTAALVAELAAQYDTDCEAIVLSWLLRHPVGIQPVIGTTNVDRIRACCGAPKIDLSREHWYALWVEARGEELP